MSNIHTAKSSLRAELAHLQAGLSYYQSRVEAVASALDQLDAIEEETGIDLPEEKSQKKTRQARKGRMPAVARKSARAAGHSAGAGRLPSTGGNFFPDLITSQKQSTAALLRAAAAKLPFKAAADEMVQLRSRMVAALAAMRKAGKIQSEGKGRARTYFR